MLELQSIVEIAGKLLNGIDDVFSLLFILFIVMSFLDGAVRRKQTKIPPPPLDGDLNIPTLANDPTVAVEQEVVVEPKKKRRAELKTPSIRPTQSERTQPVEKPMLNADDALNAMIAAEIFDKPKALRRR